MKKEKAITLIALIVTIIVLLILAGVSITMLSGENGILSKAKYAKESSDKAGIEEENKLGQYNESIDNYISSRGSVTLSQEQYDSILSRLDSLEATNTKTKLWEGDIYLTNQSLTLSESIENYRYLMIKDKWQNTNSIQSRMIDVSDIKKTGYFASPSADNSHFLVAPHDVYYAFLTFVNSTTIVIPNENGNYVHIVGVYGIK